MPDLLAHTRPIGTYGAYVSRTAGVAQWPKLTNLDQADRQLVEDVQRGRRQSAIIITEAAEIFLVEHFPTGNNASDGSRWGYRVYRVPDAPIGTSNADASAPDPAMDPSPTIISPTMPHPRKAMAIVGLLGLAAGTIAGGGAALSILSSRLEAIETIAEKVAAIAVSTQDDTQSIRIAVSEEVLLSVVQMAVSQTNLVQRIEAQTKADAMKTVITAFLNEIASQGNPSVELIVRKLRNGCRFEDWENCNQ